ncbi:MAG: ATP-binding protein [Candidatus Marinimicrobia bacterium]|nr:ATP-binding protein [Candidatus Neomarinimicrobiota bacterium]
MYLQAVSKLAKKLNSSKKGPFENKISIPYLGNEGTIDLKTICNALNRNRLIYKDEGHLFFEDYDQTIKIACERINDYFDLFSKYLNDLWTKGVDGFLLSTAGIGVLFAMYSDLLINLTVSERKSQKKHFEFWHDMMLPVIEHLEVQNDETLRNYIKASVGRAQSTDLQVTFTDLIVKSKRSGTFNSPFWKKYQENRLIKEETSFLDLLDREEGITLDFKGSFKLDVNNLIKGNGKTIIKPNIARDGVIKVISSFLNTKGGDVILGLIEKQFYPEVERDNLDFVSHNDFYLLGIEEEIKTTKNMTKERYQNDLIQSFDSHFDCKYPYNITFHPYKGVTLCRVSVDSLPPNEDCYIDGKIFYGRRGAKSDPLVGREIQLHKSKYSG